ncbi:mdlA [Symbiodinium natans]|uniref:MdlA protein n=1 Tax=Symbiodinium natans TaxID=878477 RepID=A0A812KVQ1_9DINO|nr:mdlA [Symbiodinium natans]
MTRNVSYLPTLYIRAWAGGRVAVRCLRVQIASLNESRERTHAARGRANRGTIEELSRPKSHEALYQALNDYGRVLDARAAANSLAALARLDAARATSKVREGARPSRGEGVRTPAADAATAEGNLAKRLKSVLDHQEDLPPLAVANLLWSLAKLTAREPFGQLTQGACQRVVASVPKLTARDLSTALWALAVLVADAGFRGPGRHQLQQSLLLPLKTLADGRQLEGVNLTQSLWAAAKLAEHGAEDLLPLVASLATCGLGQASTFECHSISVSLWSLGISEQLHQKPELQQFAKELAEVAILLASAMNAQMLANCAWGACRVGLADGSRFYDAMATAGLVMLRTKNAAVLDQHICGLLWTFAKIEVQTERTRQFMLHVAKEGRRGGRLWHMSHYHLASVAWALAKAFTPDGQVLRQEALPALQDEHIAEPMLLALSVAAQRVCEDPRPFRAKDLGWILWACARIGLTEPVLQMLPAVVRRMAWPEVSDESEVNSQDYFMVLWSMAALDIGWPALPSDAATPFLRAAITALKAVDARDEANFLSIAAWACAVADLRAPADELIAHTLERAYQAQREPGGSWKLRAKVLVAYAKVLHPEPPRPSEVDFVADVYEEGRRLGRAAEVEEWHSHNFHLSMLYLALRFLPQFRARRRNLLPPEVQNDWSISSSDLHKDVQLVLTHLGLGSQMRSEIFLEGGLSVDTMLPPRTRAPEIKPTALPACSACGYLKDLVKLDHWVVVASTCRIAASREDEGPDDLILEEGDQLRTVDHAIARIFRDGDIRWLTVPPSSQVYRNLEPLLGPQGIQRLGYVKIESAAGPLLRRHTAVDTGVTITELSSYGEPWVVEHDQVVVRRGPSTTERPVGIMIKGDVVGVRRRKGNWVELTQDSDVRFKKREGGGDPPIAAMNGLRRHKVSETGRSRSSSSVLMPDSEASAIGLQLNLRKCEVVALGPIDEGTMRASFPAALLLHADGSGRVLRNFEFLGAAIGDDDFIQTHTLARAEKAGELLEALAELEDPQVGLRLLRACAGFCRMVHSMRCNPPAAQAAALAHFDGLVRRCLGGLTGIHVTAEQWLQASRGLAHAGLGLRSCSAHAPAAYLASVGASLEHCSDLDPNFSKEAVQTSNHVVGAFHLFQNAVGSRVATLAAALQSKQRDLSQLLDSTCFAAQLEH